MARGSFAERVEGFKGLRAAELGLEPEEKVEEKPEVAPEGNAEGAEVETPEGGKPEGSEAAAPEGKTDAEGRKPEGEVDPAADANAAAVAPGGWKGEIKFRGEVKNLDLSPEDLKDVIMHGVNARTIIAEHDQRVAKTVDDYWKKWEFVSKDPDTGEFKANPKGPFNYLEAAFGPEKAKQFAAEYAGVAPAAGAGSPNATEELKQIEAELARLDPDVPEDATQIRILKAEKRAIVAEQTSAKRIDERFKPFEARTQAADRAAQDYQRKVLATTLTGHRDAEVQKMLKTADKHDLLFIQAVAEDLQIERNLRIDPKNIDALKTCITDAVKALSTKRGSVVVNKEKEAKALAAKARPAPKAPPPSLGGSGGGPKPAGKKEERLPRDHPDFKKQLTGNWAKAKAAIGLK